MKLRALYSSDISRFPRITFREGLSVIFARVRDPFLKDQDSHNLGKTFLIRVLDFALLAGIDKDHPFRRNGAVFRDFVFFLELETVRGSYVTVRRAVSGRQAISIQVAEESGQDYSKLEEEAWTYSRLGEDKARELLDELLHLTAIAPYGYRKGLGYFLRRQSDYNDEFMISRFGRGKDRDWKPFMALLLGFDHELVARKYKLDRKEDDLNAALREVRIQGGPQANRFDELRGVVQLKAEGVDRLRSQINRFDFVEIESEITRETVRNVETRISDLNDRRFELERQNVEIERSLETQFGFDLRAIQAVFEEVGVTLPGALVREYEDLVSFNERISTGRKARLLLRQRKLKRELDGLQSQLVRLNQRRVTALEMVTQQETMKKFRDLQAELLREEEELVRLRQQLLQLDQASQLRQQLRRNEEQRLQLVDDVEEMVRNGSDVYSLVRGLFAEFARSILFVPAVLSVSVNQKGNLEFHTTVVEGDVATRETAEAEGASYKKILCVCFDLALLVSRAKESFYRFVYHDGVFEGLDNRRKVSLLETVRQVCARHGLQYILTVIDSDLPRDEDDSKLLFSEEEIVRELDDAGDAGRLFRMPAF